MRFRCNLRSCWGSRLRCRPRCEDHCRCDAAMSIYPPIFYSCIHIQRTPAVLKILCRSKSGKEKTHKHKEICGGPGTGWVPKYCLCVFLGHSLWGRKTHKQSPPNIQRRKIHPKNPPKIKKFIWTIFFQKFSLGSWLVPQERRQKFARTFRKKSCERGVFLVFRDFGWVFGPLNITPDFLIIASISKETPPC